MKKILLILSILFFSTPCFAFQNYLVVTDYPLTKLNVACEDIIDIKMIQNPNCKGSTFLIIPKCLGATKLTFCKGIKRIKLKVIVYEDMTCIKHVNGVKFIPIEVPTELK